jgi:hypothetical protein
VEVSELYVKQRDKLVPIAVQFADNIVGTRSATSSRKERDLWNEIWNVLYHNKMNELVQERGLLR